MPQQIFRDKMGRFTRNQKPAIIKAGSLYAFKGTVVRATNAVRTSQGSVPERYVTAHKLLSGFVPESELALIGRRKVTAYLKQA